jgi:hypothetical protein
MVAYTTYAERWHWTPEQVDNLTVEQDDWLLAIAQAMDEERDYRDRKAREAAERAAKAKSQMRR